MMLFSRSILQFTSNINIGFNFFAGLISFGFFLLFIFFFIVYFWINRPIKKFKNLKIEQDFYLNEITNAILECSRKKIGVFIIFGSYKKIQNSIISPGIRINAVISTDLLINIFGYKGTMLHDGAVLINEEDWLIEAASIFVALKETKRKLRRTGTRHMAAAELMHNTDNAIILVSETTGKISFYDGKKNKTLTIVGDERSNAALILAKLKKTFNPYLS